MVEGLTFKKDLLLSELQFIQLDSYTFFRKVKRARKKIWQGDWTNEE